MRTMLLIIFYMIFCVTSAGGDPQSHYYELGREGYELVLDMQYDEADKIFDKMIRMEPENAIGYLYKSQSFFHCWQYAFSDPEQKSLEKFRALLFKTKAIAEKNLDKDNVETLFVLGGAYGNIGLYYANTDSWVRAFWYGRKGISYIRKIVARDPEYNNAYFLLGMYNYYAATLPKVVKSLSFLLGGPEGDREKGIRQLNIASFKGDFKGDAKTFLANSVYFNEKKFEAASALLKGLQKEYPDNHYIKLALGISYRKLDRYDLSVKTLNSSLESESIRKFPNLHGYIYFTIGRVYSAMNEYEEAIPAFKKACEISAGIKGYIPDQYDAWSLYETGNAYEMLGVIDRAREYYLRVKEKDRGAYKNAQARIKKPLESAQIELTRGINYLRCKRYPQAEKILRTLAATEVIKESADNTLKAETCLSLGELEYHLKKYKDSIDTLKKVFTFFDVKKEWIKPYAHYWLARCYTRTGEKEKAEQEYNMAYKYNDDILRSRIEKTRGRAQ